MHNIVFENGWFLWFLLVIPLLAGQVFLHGDGSACTVRLVVILASAVAATDVEHPLEVINPL